MISVCGSEKPRLSGLRFAAIQMNFCFSFISVQREDTCVWGKNILSSDRTAPFTIIYFFRLSISLLQIGLQIKYDTTVGVLWQDQLN
jgi:hypothetical protein